MRRWWACLIAVLVTIGVGCGLIITEASRPLPRPDAAVANDVLQSVRSAWPTVSEQDLPPTTPRLTIVDEAGRVVLHRGEPLTDQLAAIGERAFSLDIVVDGRRVGRMFMVDTTVEQLAARDRTIWLTAVATLLVAAAMVLLWAIVLYLDLLRPFRELRKFAQSIAAGDLEAPLRMDRGNVFGAFTQGFDIMREELAASRGREEQLRTSKRTLVAQLSHDIRTPVASIEATSELLLATAPDEKTAYRTGIILDKSRQIQALVTDLFRTNQDGVSVLPVRMAEHPSTILADMLHRSDTHELIRTCRVPECLLLFDQLRLQQVFDNVIHNSYKYAHTPIDITGAIVDDYLRLQIDDYGPGLPEAELESLVGKGVRGSNAADTPGSGLGLFTSNYLMERMLGSLSCPPSAAGFQVVIEIPCAGNIDLAAL